MRRASERCHLSSSKLLLTFAFFASLTSPPSSHHQMYFQNNNDYILLPFPNVGLFQGSPELGVDVLAPELEDGLQPVSEQAGRYLDGITVDPLGGIFVASSDSDIPPNQIAQVPPGPPRGLCIPQTLSDQHRVNCLGLVLGSHT